MLDLLHRNLDSKGKQAKLKSPQELQDLLDVTRLLLADFDDRKKYPTDTKEQKTDLEEVREKFRIVKVSRGRCLAQGSRPFLSSACGLLMPAQGSPAQKREMYRSIDWQSGHQLEYPGRLVSSAASIFPIRPVGKSVQK